ncbi:MAG: peptidoglycan-binding protein, partial [Pseudomonadota bacterium]
MALLSRLSWVLLCVMLATIAAIGGFGAASTSALAANWSENFTGTVNWSQYRSRATRNRARRGTRYRRNQRRRTRATRRVKRKPLAVPALATTDASAVDGPLQLVISIPDQRIDVYRGTQHIAMSRVSTGRRGHATPKGIFTILQKNRRHYSNIYGGAPMPYMQRLTWSGIALHAGVVPGYPASHGCIRLPRAFARELFGMTDKEVHVVVANGVKVPSVINHDALFQPRPAEPIEVVVQTSSTDGLVVTSAAGVERARQRERDLLTQAYVKALRQAFHPNIDAHPRETVRLVQRLLNHLGFEAGNPDGDIGPTSRSALREFAKREDLTYRRTISDDLIDRLYWRLAEKAQTLEANERQELLTPIDIGSPVRVMITRPARQNKVRTAQELLTELGYDAGDIDGALGRTTISAVKQFQGDKELPVTGQVNDATLQALKTAAGKPPSDANGLLMVRRGYRDIFSAPVQIKEPERKLGAHVFTMMAPDSARQTVPWSVTTVSDTTRFTPELEGPASTATEALDRIEMSDDVRARVEAMLQPGSSLVVADGGWTRE